MGWYYAYGQSRAGLIKELIAPNQTETFSSECIKHCAVGNVLWTVREITYGKGSGIEGTKARYIGCDLLHRSRDGWGHKPMEESMGPYYWSCPLAYLEAVPQVTNAEWREGVRKYWVERAARAKARRERKAMYAARVAA